jgi:hypothetical protein
MSGGLTNKLQELELHGKQFWPLPAFDNLFAATRYQFLLSSGRFVCIYWLMRFGILEEVVDVRNFFSALISFGLGVFFAIVWLTTIFYDSGSIGKPTVLLGILGLPLAAVFFVWLSYRIAMQKERHGDHSSQSGRNQSSQLHTLEEAYSSSPEEFRQAMTSLFERLGYNVRGSDDTSRETFELNLDKNGKTELAWCRQSADSIPVADVTEFLTKVSSQGITKGYMVSTGYFSLAAMELTLGKGLHLVDGSELAEMMQAQDRH